MPAPPSLAVLFPSCLLLSLACGSGVPDEMETANQFQGGGGWLRPVCVQKLPGLIRAQLSGRISCGSSTRSPGCASREGAQAPAIFKDPQLIL